METKKLTPEEQRATSEANPGESVHFANCPVCSARLAIYVTNDPPKVHEELVVVPQTKK